MPVAWSVPPSKMRVLVAEPLPSAAAEWMASVPLVSVTVPVKVFAPVRVTVPVLSMARFPWAVAVSELVVLAYQARKVASLLRAADQTAHPGSDGEPTSQPSGDPA